MGHKVGRAMAIRGAQRRLSPQKWWDGPRVLGHAHQDPRIRQGHLQPHTSPVLTSGSRSHAHHRGGLRCARNATFFRHFLAHLSSILANELPGLTKKRSGEGKRVPSNATPHSLREPIRWRRLTARSLWAHLIRPATPHQRTTLPDERGSLPVLFRGHHTFISESRK